jgi:hypothetical protein
MNVEERRIRRWLRRDIRDRKKRTWEEEKETSRKGEQ